MAVGASGQPDPRWWDPASGREPHHAVFGTARWLRSEDRTRAARYLQLAQHYYGRPLSNLSASLYEERHDEEEERLRLNVARAMVSSVVAKIGKNRPRAAILTEGGNWGMQQQAKRLEQFVWGLFEKSDLYRKSPLIFRDAAIFGQGVVKVWDRVEDGIGRIGIDRVLPWELHVDPAESMYGEPRSLFQVRLVDKHVLLDRWPEHAEAIEDAVRKTSTHYDEAAVWNATDRLAQQVMVVEAWHLRSGPTAEDGRHVIAIEGATLADDAYLCDVFPFVSVRWDDPLIGYWGTGLVEEVEPVQREINELAAKIQHAMYATSTTRILLPQGSLKKDHLTNDVVTVQEYDPSLGPPVIDAARPVAPETFAHLDRLYARAFEIAGVSQLAAASRKPAGLDSGVALREYNDIESERFAIKGQALERFFVQIAKIMIGRARALHEQGVDVEVTSQRRRRRRNILDRIKWSEVALSDDAFEMKVHPASSLPQSPAGRIATVTELVSAQLITPDDAKQLLDFPDVEALMSRELAPYEVILDQIELMIDEGEQQAPEPFMNLELTLRVSTLAYLRAKIDRVPEDRLDLLRTFINSTEEMIRGAAAQAAPAAPAPPPQGGGVPVTASGPMPVPMPGAAA